MEFVSGGPACPSNISYENFPPNEQPQASFSPFSRSTPTPSSASTSESAENAREADPKRRSKKDKVKRPMNVFMVWARSHRKKVALDNPTMTNSEVSKLLGQIWKGMSRTEREPFKEMADQINREHRAMYPDYQYKPRRKVVKKIYTKSPSEAREGSMNNIFWDLTIMNHPGIVPRPKSFSDKDLLINGHGSAKTLVGTKTIYLSGHMVVPMSQAEHAEMSIHYKPLQSLRPFVLEREFYRQKASLVGRHSPKEPNALSQHRFFPSQIQFGCMASFPGHPSKNMAYQNLPQNDSVPFHVDQAFQNLYRYSVPFNRSV